MKRERVLSQIMFFLFFLTAIPAAAQTGGVRGKKREHTWFTMSRVERPLGVGVYGGYANNSLYQGGAEYARPGIIQRNGNGWTAGLALRWQIFNWLALQADPAYITRSYSNFQAMYINDTLSPHTNTTTNSFIDVPLMLSFHAPLAENLRFTAGAGYYAGFWLASHEQGISLMPPGSPDSGEISSQSYNVERVLDPKRDNRFDHGAIASVGIQYDFTQFKPCHVSIFVEGRYWYGLSDLQKPYQRNLSPLMQSTLTVHAGILIQPEF
ncbi:MAG: PorT family protein [Spirochaetaceae bacterium]|jgi:hypothetical protein|nr:PorT family protein [Spirochaetaceae bacterium]